MDAQRIEFWLDELGASIGRPLVVLAETASTNDDAKGAADAPHGATFVADTQTGDCNEFWFPSFATHN